MCLKLGRGLKVGKGITELMVGIRGHTQPYGKHPLSAYPALVSRICCTCPLSQHLPHCRDQSVCVNRVLKEVKDLVGIVLSDKVGELVSSSKEGDRDIIFHELLSVKSSHKIFEEGGKANLVLSQFWADIGVLVEITVGNQ